MSKTILLAEDEPITRKLVDAALVKAGYQVNACANGAECLEALRQGVKPCLLILDLHMPRVDGIGVLDGMKLQGKTDQFPVLILSAENQQDIVTRALTSGAHDYIMKPVNVRVLVERAADLIFEFEETAVRRLLESLNMEDPTLWREHGLQSYAQGDYLPYRAVDRGKTVALLIAGDVRPKQLAKKDLQAIEQAMIIFRKARFGWVRVWPHLREQRIA